MVVDRSTANRQTRINSASRFQNCNQSPQARFNDYRQCNRMKNDKIGLEPTTVLKPTLRQSMQVPPPDTNLDEQTKRLKLRSQRLTVCLLCLVGAVSSLTPLTISTHATQRVGLMLLETDLIHFRASFVALVICASLLMSLFFGQKFLVRFTNLRPLIGSRTAQKVCKLLICMAAATSAISNLSTTLIVPHVKQIQRMPLATFDCNANQIAIENCLQRFSAKNGKQTVLDAVQLLLAGGLDGHSERLIRKLNCFNFNNEQLDRLKVPTRFLLHQCGLVCKPQRQQLYQFNDDLNRDQATTEGMHSDALPDTTEASHRKVPPGLQAPYADKTTPMSGTHLLSVDQTGQSDIHELYSGQVSLKVCFWGEFSGGSSYKQFCITNLADETRNSTNSDPGRRVGHSLSVGQMNALLKRYSFSDDIDGSAEQQPKIDEDINTVSASTQDSSERLVPSNAINDQSTSYVNPIVQFESQFKDWPLLQRPHRDEMLASDYRSQSDSWCHFRPIPPFIVNNKPFNDIQCSIEHEYTMTTRSSGQVSSDQIYLKKQPVTDSSISESSSYLRERCSIQCKVNLLYRTHVNGHDQQGQTVRGDKLKDRLGQEPNTANFYLPLKPCSFVVGNGNKSKTAIYYLNLRTIGDTSLIITVILLNILLLVESIDTKKFTFEARRFRLFGVILVAAIMPPLASGLLELGGYLLPTKNHESEQDGYLIALINERFLPTVSDWFDGLTSPQRKQARLSQTINSNLPFANRTQVYNTSLPMLDRLGSTVPKSIDYFVVPFFVYAIFMCMLSITALRLPVVAKPEATFVRVASTEILNLKRHNQENRQVESNVDDSSRANLASLEDMDRPRGLSSQGRSKLQQVRSDYHIGFFLTIVWFMGVQFWLSLYCQTQIMIDIFGPLNGLALAMSPTSAAAVIALVVATLFRDEISTFMSELSPFTIELVELKRKVEFNKYLSVATLTYALRYFILVNLNSSSNFSWPLVILFQMGEILNFPLIWFTISKRAYELSVLDKKPLVPSNKSARQASGNNNSESILNNLIVLHLALSVVYFALARSSAIFLHTANTSLHLHDDNVDWFIKSFYGEQLVAATKSQQRMSTIGPMNHTRGKGRQDSITHQLQPLFSPLPDEHQTYLHASRLFIKSNSLICLIIGMILFGNFLYAKFTLYNDQEKRRSAIEKERQAKLNRHEHLTDRQLVLDLKRLHTESDKETNYSDSVDSFGVDEQLSNQLRGKRARVLFRYDTKLPQADSSSSEIEITRVVDLPKNDRVEEAQEHVEEEPGPEQDHLQSQHRNEMKDSVGDGTISSVRDLAEKNATAPLAIEEMDDVELGPVDGDNQRQESRGVFSHERDMQRDTGLKEKYSRVVSKRVRIVETKNNK